MGDNSMFSKKIVLKTTMVFSLLVFSTGTLFCTPFIVAGPRALGLGGAYTAIAQTSLGAYWNPGALDLQEGFDLKFNFGAGAEITGNLLENANNIIQFSDQFSQLQSSQKNGSGLDIKQISAISSAIKNLNGVGAAGNGTIINIAGGLGVRVGKYVLTVNNYSLIGIRPYTEIYGFYLGSGTFNVPTGLRSGILSHGDSSQNFEGINISTEFINSPDAQYTDETAQIKTQLDWLLLDLKKAGVEVPATLPDGTPFTTDMIANVLVNTAVNNGSTEQDLKDSIAIIEESKPILELVLGSADPRNSFSNNKSNLTIRGLSVTEIGLSAAWPLYFKDLYLGGTLKMMMGQTGFYRKLLFENTGGDNKVGLDDSVSDMSKNTKNSSQFGFDLGFFYDKKQDWRSSFGLTLKNINSPKFAMPEAALSYGEDTITLDPQIRAGAAFYPLNWILLSSDIDITNNTTLIPDYNSRYWSLGVEINLVNESYFNLPLRFGMMKNLASTKDTSAYTAGIGLNLGRFVIDLSGAMSTTMTKIDTDSSGIPSNVSGQLGLGLEF